MTILLLVTVNALAGFVLLYSIAYTARYTSRGLFYLLFLLLLAGINGVILARELLWLFLALEVASLSAYGLVAFGGEKPRLEAALKYFVMGELASLCILMGMGLVHHKIAAYLFILGFGVKAALFPLHLWLPDAHSAAPSPVSAMLSGVVIKVLGVYALWRTIGFYPPTLGILSMLGVLSILYGGFLAIRQWDMKRLMAYSSISQVGYIVLGLSLATPLGVAGALFHLFNHAFMKGLMFLTAGAVEQKCGTRDLRELGGLRQKMPVTAFSSFLGSLAMSGIPPFGGFWSKLFIIMACAQIGQIWFAAAAIVGAILTMAAFLKIQRCAFFSAPRDNLQDVKEVSWLMALPMLCLALLCLGAGIFFPTVTGRLINPAVMTMMQMKGFFMP
jgi:multicomponent Na+:H+ antiporter subunit D